MSADSGAIYRIEGQYENVSIYGPLFTKNQMIEQFDFLEDYCRFKEYQVTRVHKTKIAIDGHMDAKGQRLIALIGRLASDCPTQTQMLATYKPEERTTGPREILFNNQEDKEDSTEDRAESQAADAQV